MIRLVRAGAAVAAGWCGAALWAYGIAVLQPLCEPGSPLWDGAQNNTYWARDVRWSAILAVVAALVAAARGSARRGIAAAGAGLIWIGADLVLDRIDPGRPALMPATVTAGVILTGVAVVLAVAPSSWFDPFLSSRSTPSQTSGPSARFASRDAAVAALRSRRRSVLLSRVAMTCLVAALSVANLESPSDSEPQLRPSRLAAYALLTLAALMCALGALPAGTWNRRAWAVLAGAAGWIPVTATHAAGWGNWS
jgi:hypothetical protein